MRSLSFAIIAASPKPAKVSVSIPRSVQRRVKDLIRPNPKRLEDVGSERVDQRDVRRVLALRDNDSAYPWDIACFASAAMVASALSE